MRRKPVYRTEPLGRPRVPSGGAHAAATGQKAAARGNGNVAVDSRAASHPGHQAQAAAGIPSIGGGM